MNVSPKYTLLTLFVLPLLATAQVELPGPEACAEELWRQTYLASSVRLEQIYAIEPLEDGGIVTAGGFATAQSEDNSPDFWVSRLDGDGNIVWNTVIPHPHFSWLYDIKQTADGGFITVGMGSRRRVDPVTGGNQIDRFLSAHTFKLDADGAIEWRQDFEDPLQNEMLRNIIALPNGNFMLTGSQAEMPGPNGPTEEFWFREITTDGELVREFFPAIATLESLVPYFSDFERTAEGDFVGVSHVFCPTSPQEDSCFMAYPYDLLRISKIDGQGNPIFDISPLPLANAPIFSTTTIKATNDGGVLIAGTRVALETFDENFCLLKLDADGALEWETELTDLSTNGSLSSIVELECGNFLVGGMARQNENSNTDILFFKVNGEGGIECQKVVESPGREEFWISDMAVQEDGIFVAFHRGGFSPDARGNNFDISAAAAGLVNIDAIVMKLGSFICPTDFEETITFCGEPFEPIELETCNAPANFLWQDGSTESSLLATEPGTYSVTISDESGACAVSDTVVIEAIPLLDIGPADTLLCNPDGLLLTADLPEGATYRWQDGSTAAEFLVQEPGTYTVEAQLGECTQTDSITVRLCDPCLEIPNAFTPDGDDLNDTFRPYFGCIITNYDFKIYNRWGQVVFESTTPNEAWDGQVNGNPAPSDAYVYVLNYERLEEGQSIADVRRGEVLLLR